MGRAIITNNLGNGLYRIKLKYNMVPVDREIASLSTASDDYDGKLLAALDTRRELGYARDDARDGLDAVVLQWKEALIDAATEDPPPIPPVVEGGQPEDEQPGLLLDEMNAARGDNLTRDSALDNSPCAC
jgi:hypothetical protein